MERGVKGMLVEIIDGHSIISTSPPSSKNIVPIFEEKEKKKKFTLRYFV
jgi:hypothetical protein